MALFLIFSGLVGLSMVKDLPNHFSQLVIMNTGLPTGNDWKAINSFAKLQRVLPFCLWRAFVSLFATLLPVEFIFKQIVGCSNEIAKAYNAPFPSSTYKGPNHLLT